MDKRKPQASQPNNGGIGTSHPLLSQMTQVDAFTEAARKRAEFKEFQIAELETWTQTMLALASSQNGQLFLKSMIQHSGMFEPASYRDTLKMVDVRLKSEFYLKWVRPFLTPDLRSAIE